MLFVQAELSRIRRRIIRGLGAVNVQVTDAQLSVLADLDDEFVKAERILDRCLQLSCHLSPKAAEATTQPSAKPPQEPPDPADGWKNSS